MTTSQLSKFLGIAAAAMFFLGTSAAHAAPAGTFTRYGLASFPTSGSNKGKYAEAWVDLLTNNCGKTGTSIPLCFEAKAALNGKVMNAQVEAINTAGHVRQNTAAGNWDWGYSVAVFGTTLVNPSGSISNSQIKTNLTYGQPLISQDNPFMQRGQVALSIDLSILNAALGILPDAVVTVHYSVWGGFSTELDVAPITAYGALAKLTIQPRGSMQASCNTTYTAGPVRATLVTPANVQVIAPSSDVKLEAGFAFGNNGATVTYTPNVRLLKGQVNYLVEFFDPISAIWGNAWNDLDSGTLWNQTASYALYLNTGATTTLFQGTLSQLPKLTF